MLASILMNAERSMPNIFNCQKSASEIIVKKNCVISSMVIPGFSSQCKHVMGIQLRKSIPLHNILCKQEYNEKRSIKYPLWFVCNECVNFS